MKQSTAPVALISGLEKSGKRLGRSVGWLWEKSNVNLYSIRVW
jgi:hypothetical protein